VCTYAYDLCRSFSRFNNACRVKDSEGPLLQGRLLLVQAFVHALREALAVLGIGAPLRM
jgi:arginyl-tRNA synthetase